MSEPKEPRSNEREQKPKEVERKFKINLEDVPFEYLEIARELDITQAYLAIAEGGSEIRVRRTSIRDSIEEPIYELTTKMKGTLSRPEETIGIDEQLFTLASQNHVGNIIHKTRLEIPYDEYTIELDVYLDDLSGLVVAEVEFTGQDEEQALLAASEFIPPEWFGSEVTENKAFKNQSLARYGRPA